MKMQNKKYISLLMGMLLISLTACANVEQVQNEEQQIVETTETTITLQTTETVVTTLATTIFSTTVTSTTTMTAVETTGMITMEEIEEIELEIEQASETQATGRFTAEQLDQIRRDLWVPDDLDVEVIQHEDASYWEAAGMWITLIEVRYQGKTIASVFVDADTGEWARGIWMYDESNLYR